MNFRHILETLEKIYGPPPANPAAGPWEMVLLENSAYLADDEQRERAFNALRDRIGLTPAGSKINAVISQGSERIKPQINTDGHG
jgi:hypothetical protein